MANPSVTTVTKRVPGNSSIAIQQRITSGGNFDGTLPQAAGPVRADSPISQGNSVYKYAAAAKGGLFFWDCNEALVCTQIHVSLGAAADVSIYIVNLDTSTINGDSPTSLSGEDILIEQATGVTFLALDEARFKTVLLPYQGIKIVTTANANAQIAQVVACLERSFVR